jgi:hypothetical protein
MSQGIRDRLEEDTTALNQLINFPIEIALNWNCLREQHELLNYFNWNGNIPTTV